MHPTAVFAAASSRLHADILLIRLMRAGIARDKLSAIFPERLTPNCALCWLEGESVPTPYDGENVRMAGPAAKMLSTKNEAAFARSLEKIGLQENEASSYAERLGQGQIIVCVHPSNEDEVAIAWHICCELNAEGLTIAIGEKSSPPRKTWFPRRERVVLAMDRGAHDLRMPGLAMAM